MREAAIEREWHAAVLSYGHQARAARSGNPDGARALLFATMGYPPPFPDGWDQASAMMLADEARYLAGADLYVLTPQMLDVVIAAAQSLTFADLGLLREDDLPSPSGAVVLPRPLATRHPSGSLLREIAFTWRSPSQVPLPGGMGFGRAGLPAVRMSGYTTAARPSRGFMQAARAQRVALPPMLLEVVWSLPLHPDTPGQVHDYDRLAAALRGLNAAYWQDEARTGEAGDQGQAAGEYASGAILDQDQDGTLGSRFLYAFWRLCEQQIGAVQASPLGGADAQGPAVVPEPAAAQGDLPRAFRQGRHGQAAARRGGDTRTGQVGGCPEPARASRPHRPAGPADMNLPLPARRERGGNQQPGKGSGGGSGLSSPGCYLGSG
jgi:hypothetical protein